MISTACPLSFTLFHLSTTISNFWTLNMFCCPNYATYAQMRKTKNDWHNLLFLKHFFRRRYDNFDFWTLIYFYYPKYVIYVKIAQNIFDYAYTHQPLSKNFGSLRQN